jgi:CRP-like cAMP-binding protein
MMMFFADELMLSEQKLKADTLTSDEKIASASLFIVNAFGYKDTQIKYLDLGMSFGKLASFAAISFPTSTRVFNTFTQSGLIKVTECELYILDEHALRNMTKMAF